ncbi:MAG: hypothetical protein J6Y95_05140 [Lachnospiraceae bacterium]|nr:hypothetical protein [Lachnospiraceae bacterium]
MIRLTEITEENWLEAASLSVKEEQKAFLAPAGSLPTNRWAMTCSSL